MATGDGLQASEITVKIGAADAAYSTCTTFTQSLTNFSQSGGGKDIESVALFGGAFLNREKPREQIEVSFDTVYKYGTCSDIDGLLMGSSLTASTVESSQEPSAWIIWLYWTDGTNKYTRAYNNVQGVNLGDLEQSAEGFLEGKVSFKLSATDSTGASNMKSGEVDPSTLSF